MWILQSIVHVFYVVTRTMLERRLLASQSHESLLTSSKPSLSADAVPNTSHLVSRTIELADSAGSAVAIHPLHSSVLGQKHCFQVSTRAGNTYFACRSDDERREWMEQYVTTYTFISASLSLIQFVPFQIPNQPFIVHAFCNVANTAGK